MLEIVTGKANKSLGIQKSLQEILTHEFWGCSALLQVAWVWMGSISSLQLLKNKLKQNLRVQGNLVF